MGALRQSNAQIASIEVYKAMDRRLIAKRDLYSADRLIVSGSVTGFEVFTVLLLSMTGAVTISPFSAAC
jgi:hypothetical protein